MISSPAIAQSVKTLPLSRAISSAQSKRQFYESHEVLRWIDKRTVLMASETLQNGSWKLSSSVNWNEISGTLLIQLKEGAILDNDLNNFIENRYGDLVILKNHKGLVRQLVDDPSVIFIQKLQEAQIETNIPEHDLTANHFDWIKSESGLSGTGQLIGLKERRADTLDIDLRKKFIPSALSDESFDTHATAMATIIGGRGISSIKSLGAASSAQLVSSSFTNVFPDNPSFLDQMATQNHSYGFSVQNEYDALAASYDEAISEDDFTLHVFSAGNLGFETPESGAYAGLGPIANLSGGIKQAKNTLVVGATNRMHQVDERSSRGPAFDGRIKPELVAYGSEGTSESAALVSSASALLQEQYQLEQASLAPNYLIKSILISSASDTEIAGPDFISGFGRLNLNEATKVISQDQYFLGISEESEVQEQSVLLSPEVKSIRVALSWNDPAANIGDFMTLVNDLDLEVVYNGVIHKPLVPDPTPDLSIIFQPAVEKRDSINNNELVIISGLTGGEITLRVKGQAIDEAGQPYALTYSFDKRDQFEWLVPREGVAQLIEEDYFLRYQNTFENDVELAIRQNEGAWEVIGPIAGYPSTQFAANGIYEYKATVDGKEFVSPQILVHPRLTVQKLYECGDDLLFNWSDLGAETYQLYGISEVSFEKVLIGSTSDTSAFLSRGIPELSLEKISLKPTINGLLGLDSDLYDFGSDGIGCYVKSFTSAVDDGQVRLSLELTTNLNVEEVSFVREQEGAEFNFSSSKQGLLYTGLSIENRNGYYTYKGLINLSNSELGIAQIETPGIEIPVIIPEVSTLFPNPVPEGAELFFLGSDNVSRLRLFSTNGNYSTVIYINGNEEFFELKGISSGFYFYQLIDREDQVIKTGKLIIE